MTREEAIAYGKEQLEIFGGLHKEFIQTAIEALEQYENAFEHGYTEAESEYREILERKRGEWIDGLDIPKEERERHPYVYLHGEKFCSVCYKEAYFDTDYGQQLFDYCPNCGSRMKEVEDER